MTEMLVTLILAICPADGLEVRTTPCMEQMVNCVIGPGGKWNHKDVESCTQEVIGGNVTSSSNED